MDCAPRISVVSVASEEAAPPCRRGKWPIFQQGPPIVPKAGREVLQLHVAGANYGSEFSFWSKNPSSPIAKQRCMMATVPQACGYVPRGQLEVAAKSPKSKPSSMLLREPKLEIHRNESKLTSGSLEGHKARARRGLWRNAVDAPVACPVQCTTSVALKSSGSTSKQCTNNRWSCHQRWLIVRSIAASAHANQCFPNAHISKAILVGGFKSKIHVCRSGQWRRESSETETAPYFVIETIVLAMLVLKVADAGDIALLHDFLVSRQLSGCHHRTQIPLQIEQRGLQDRLLE